ncbi:hypothetical protein R3W88_025001 [Solanum pinnatisectum]|uniref:Uncharacterized protein n=1 Tax=Solanum pinnatisectum TaxID=50273 RepID=A0AAV9M2L5_9SOLN|nr:hypothetical protein R3W88_025001 [Solanum pinnatisectum]
MSDQISRVLSFSTKNKISLPNPKTLLCLLRKGEIAAKMEKGKNIEMEPTEEDLRRKLKRLKREIEETRERRMEVEIATAIAQVANTALDEELATKMTKYAIMNEETAAIRKEHDAFNNDMTMRLQKIQGKCSFVNQETNSGPENTHPGATEEDTGEEIVYKPHLQGRRKEENKNATPKEYEFALRE